METIDRKYRGLEIWDVDDVAPEIRDEATLNAAASDIRARLFDD